MNLHRDKSTKGSWPKEHPCLQTQGRGRVVVRMVLVLTVSGVDGNHTFPVEEKVRPPHSENVRSSRTNPRSGRGSRQEKPHVLHTRVVVRCPVQERTIGLDRDALMADPEHTTLGKYGPISRWFQ